MTGYGAAAGEPLVTHPKVAKVAFTGGSATGARVGVAGRPDLQEGVAGTRRQVAQHRVRRRHHRRCGQRRDLRHLRRNRPDLHRRLAPAGAGEHPRRVRREAAGGGQDRQARQPAIVRHPGRPGDDAAAVPARSSATSISPRARAPCARSAAARPRRPKAAASTSSSRRSSPASTTRCGSPRKKCSGRCCR